MLRRFGETPPAEWRAAINEIPDYQLQRGMRRALGSGKAHAPSLPEFLSWCRAVGPTEGVPDDPPQRTALPGPDRYDDFDVWALAANQHLFAYVLRKMGEKKADFNADQTRVLVTAKNAWGQDMRDVAQSGGVPVEFQQKVWREYVQTAENTIEGMRK